jgi:spore maturation protein CgeB
VTVPLIENSYPPLHVVIYGEDWSPAGSWLMGQAYVRLGHRVRYYRQDVGLEAYDRMPWRLYRRFMRRVREADRRRHTAGLIAAARDHAADIVIILGGLQVGPDDVNAMRANGAWVINYNYDDFFSRFRSGWSHVQRAALPAYDLLVCTKQYNVAEVMPLNPRATFIRHAYDPGVHRPVPIPESERSEWESDIVFVGQWAKHRGMLMDRLVRAVPARYAIRGPGWEKLSRSSPVRPFVRSSHVYGDDMAKALGGAKLCLGFLRKENRDDYTTRTFEIPACGGVLLAERTPMHQSLFHEGVEAEFFDHDRPQELIEKVRLLLADDERRESIRRAGMAALARGRHTYDDRVGEVLALYESRPSRPT